MADAEALLGTWKMVSWTRKNVASGEITDAMGPDPIGYIAYHADGRMMAVVIRRDRPKVNGRALSVPEMCIAPSSGFLNTLHEYAAPIDR